MARFDSGNAVKKVDNQKDLEEVPVSVKNSLNIIPVETIDDVVKHAIKIK